MIDFQNAVFLKLKMVDGAEFTEFLSPMLIEGEVMISAFRGVRDGLVFTNKRVMAMNVQGITGKKKDLTSMPYRNIQVYAVETAGVLDLDSVLELWFAGVGKVRFEFTNRCNLSEICKTISEFVLEGNA